MLWLVSLTQETLKVIEGFPPAQLPGRERMSMIFREAVNAYEKGAEL